MNLRTLAKFYKNNCIKNNVDSRYADHVSPATTRTLHAEGDVGNRD